MRTNYHTHTTRCLHATGSDEEFVLSAIKGGYQELGFSDHTPWKYHTDYVSDIRMTPEQLPGYVERPDQHQNRTGMRILSGIYSLAKRNHQRVPAGLYHLRKPPFPYR